MKFSNPRIFEHYDWNSRFVAFQNDRFEKQPRRGVSKNEPWHQTAVRRSRRDQPRAEKAFKNRGENHRRPVEKRKRSPRSTEVGNQTREGCNSWWVSGHYLDYYLGLPRDEYIVIEKKSCLWILCTFILCKAGH